MANNKIFFEVGPVTFAYPHLDRPDSTYNKENPDYAVSAVMEPNDPALARLKKDMSEAAGTFGLPKGYGTPLKPQTEKDEDGMAVPTGKFIFKAKSKYATVMRDARGNILSPEKFHPGGGTLGVIKGYFSPYSQNGKRGLSCYLTEAVILKYVEKQYGSAPKIYEGYDALVDPTEASEPAQHTPANAENLIDDMGI